MANAPAPAPAPQQPSVDPDDAAWAALTGGASGGKGGAANGGATGAPSAGTRAPVAANDDDAAWQALGGSKPGPSASPAPAAPNATPEPPSFWDQFKTRIAAGVERVAGAAQEVGGEGGINSSQRIFWQATILPEALRLSKQNGTQLTDDPGVQSAAKLLGLTPVDFVSGADAYARLSPDRIKQVIDGAKGDMSKFGATAASGAGKRAEAGQMEQNYAPGFGEGHGVKNFALQTASVLPDLAVALGLSASGVGALPATALLATDFGLRGYSTARDNGLDNQSAMGYGAISGLIASTTEIPVMSVLGKTPAANAILENALGRVVANSTVGKIAGVAVNQTAAGAVQGALQAALDKGTINPNMSLADALRTIRDSAAGGLALGVGVGAAHVGGHRLVNGPAPKLGAEPAPAGAPATAPDTSGATNAPLAPVTEAARQAALSRAAQTGGLLQDAETEEDAENGLATSQQAAQTREVAQRNAEDHFEPLAEDSLAAVNQTVTPARRPVVEAGPANAVEHAQRDAAAHVAAQGGDALSQVVAATHANSIIGGIHDAAAVQGAREAVQAANMRETQRQAADAALAAQQAPDQSEFTWMDEPAEKAGRPNEPPLPPRTLAETLTPEQVQAFKTLRDRRAAEMAQPESTAPETPAPDAQPNRLAAIRAAAEKRAQVTKPAEITEPAKNPEPVTKAAAPVEEEAEQPETNPPPATPKTLAERRQAQVDAAMAAKVRGAAQVEAAAHEAATSPKNELPMPTKAQQNAGNFQMGHTQVDGIPISIEHPEGAARPSGATPEGGHYGYIKGTVDADGMHTDAIVGKQPASGKAWVVDHLDQDGNYQQHKVLLGFDNKLAAMRSYRSVFPDNPLGKVSEVSTGDLKDWLAKGDQTKPFAPEAPAAPAPRASQTMHGQSIAERQAREAEFNRGANFQRLMSAKRGEHEALTANMPVEEAKTHLDRLNAAPGDNPAAREALESRTETAGETAEAPSQRKTLTLAGRRARFADSDAPASGPRDLTRLTGLQLKRLAHTGDPAAQAEMDRRLNALPSEPRGGTPEAQYVARNRDSGAETARYNTQAEAADHAERFSQDRVAKEASEQPAPAAKRNAFRDTQPGDRRGPAITKEEATQRLQPLIDRVGADKLHVHDSLDDPEVPQNIRDDAAALNHPDPRAAFDPKTGAIHVFAGAGGHTDLESLHDTAIHEMAHRGVRSFLGDEYAATMQSVFDNIHDRAGALRSPIDGVRKASAREWMEDYLSQHAMDPKNPAHQQIAADEYVASIAEHDANDPQQQNPSILRRVIDAVRAGLRRVGVVHEWRDSDIRRLLRESNNNPGSPHARAAREDFGNGIRWADSPDRSVERLPPDDPRAIAAKYQRVLADSANYNPGYVKSRIDALARLKDFLPDWADHAWEQAKDGGRRLWLYSIPLDKLPDHVNPDLNPSVRGYVRTVRRMNGRIGEQMAAAHEIYKPWNDFAQREPERAAALDDLMHESTLAGADPSKPFENRFSDEQRARSPKKTAADAARKARYDEMRPRFRALGDEGQRIYNDVRDAYKQQRADHDAALEQRMKDLGMSDAGRKQVMALLQRDKHESGRVPEPYFPLARWGDRYAVAKLAGTDEVHSYSRFETNRQQKQWADAMRAEGHDVTEGRDTGSNKAASHGVDPVFLHKVLELTKDFEPKEGSEDGASSIADEIYQHYLSSLPDRSYRKIFMHRTGRLGFAGNARRAFADQSIRHAKAVASIEYGHKLDAMLESVSTEQKKIAQLASSNPGNRYLQREAAWAPDVSNELQNRHSAIRNPGSNRFVNALTGFGFHYYLGFNPATAARIHTQQYINALPWLGARHGWGPAADALKTAMGQFAGSRGNFGDVLRGDERRAWDEMRDNGTFMNTQAQSLTSASRGDALQRSGTSNAAKWAARANYASTFMFNGIEHFNRETTAISAFRLATKEGKSYGEALEHAMTASDTTHFDYSPANRPRILQGQAGKVGGLFAQYSVHQAYRIVRDARDGLLGNRNISSEERRARLGTLAGMIGMSSLIAGAGTVAAPVFGAINLAVNAGSDEPAFDSKAATHAYLVQHLGSKFLADMIMSGPISAATGASLGSTGLWDVFHRESSGDTAHANWYTRIAPYVPVFGSMLQGGPLGELGQDLYTAANDLREGNTERAIEHMLPMGFRGVPKALRHALYGEQSPSALPGIENAQTAPKSEFGIRAFLSQLANFTPLSLADRREENAAKQAAVQSIDGTPGTGGPRAQLLRQLVLAAVKGDDKALDAAIAQAQKFNATNPGMAIDSDTVEKSAQAQQQNAQQQVHGVMIPKGMRDRLQQLYSQDLEPPDTPGDTTGATALANENP